MKENSYSDHKKSNFDCGRYKLLTEVNGEDAEEVDKDIIKRKKREASDVEIDEDFVFTFSSEDQDKIFCGNTIINDRYKWNTVYHNLKYKTCDIIATDG